MEFAYASADSTSLSPIKGNICLAVFPPLLVFGPVFSDLFLSPVCFDVMSYKNILKGFKDAVRYMRAKESAIDFNFVLCEQNNELICIRGELHKSVEVSVTVTLPVHAVNDAQAPPLPVLGLGGLCEDSEELPSGEQVLNELSDQSLTAEQFQNIQFETGPFMPVQQDHQSHQPPTNSEDEQATKANLLQLQHATKKFCFRNEMLHGQTPSTSSATTSVSKYVITFFRCPKKDAITCVANKFDTCTTICVLEDRYELAWCLNIFQQSLPLIFSWSTNKERLAFKKLLKKLKTVDGKQAIKEELKSDDFLEYWGGQLQDLKPYARFCNIVSLNAATIRVAVQLNQLSVSEEK